MSTPPRLARPVCSTRRSPRASWLLATLAAGALWCGGPVAWAADAAAPAKDAGKPAAKGKGKGKSKGKKPKGTAATLSQMLTDRSSQVQDCAGKALDKGSDRVDIATKVTINNRGQVISLNTHVTLDKGDGDPVKQCIETLVRGIAFPPSDAPMITIERNWTIASK
jgi:hypothetical protein